MDVPRLIYISFDEDDDISMALNEDEDDDGDMTEEEDEKVDSRRKSFPSKLKPVAVLRAAKHTFRTSEQRRQEAPRSLRGIAVTPDHSVCTSNSSEAKMNTGNKKLELQQQYQRSLKRLARSMHFTDISRSAIRPQRTLLLSKATPGVPLYSATELTAYRRQVLHWVHSQNESGK